jgi:hypothetical protein
MDFYLSQIVSTHSADIDERTTAITDGISHDTDKRMALSRPSSNAHCGESVAARTIMYEHGHADTVCRIGCDSIR